MAKILLIEDDKKICEELQTLFMRYGHSCIYSMDFLHVVDFVMENQPELVLLDVNLPVFDGYHICREIRKRSEVPIIIVTSRDSQMDELMSMNLGADDFVTKPYNPQILLARIGAVLKRAYAYTPQNLEHKGVVLDPGRGVVSCLGREVELTKNEGKILKLLMENKGTVISRENIMNELWQSDEFVDDNTLTVNINRLRKKLESIGVTDFLLTRRGRGYIV